MNCFCVQILHNVEYVLVIICRRKIPPCLIRAKTNICSAITFQTAPASSSRSAMPPNEHVGFNYFGGRIYFKQCRICFRNLRSDKCVYDIYVETRILASLLFINSTQKVELWHNKCPTDGGTLERSWCCASHAQINRHSETRTSRYRIIEAQTKR